MSLPEELRRAADYIAYLEEIQRCADCVSKTLVGVPDAEMHFRFTEAMERLNRALNDFKIKAEFSE